MVQRNWPGAARRNIVCVDSYDDGILKGRLYDPYREADFSSLTQFLLKMEEQLDAHPFADVPLLTPEPVRRGSRATFELQVIFRQNTSWQGVLWWREKKTEHSFRSVLELVMLLDSALREPPEAAAC